METSGKRGFDLLRKPGALPLLVGHRGACEVAPENTLVSFARALDDGADVIELDVRLTADGHVVVIHDETVDRTTNGQGRVAALTWDALRRLDAGAWFGPQFAGERIPALAEVLAWARGRIRVLIELKYSPFGAFQRQLVPPVLAVVAEQAMDDQVAFISYAPQALGQVKALAPHIPCGPLFSGVFWLRGLVWLARRFPSLERVRALRWNLLRPLRFTQAWGCDVVAPNIAVTAPALVRAAHAKGLPVSCGGLGWDYPAAIAMGLDTLASNDPGEVRRRYLSAPDLDARPAGLGGLP